MQRRDHRRLPAAVRRELLQHPILDRRVPGHERLKLTTTEPDHHRRCDGDHLDDATMVDREESRLPDSHPRTVQEMHDLLARHVHHRVLHLAAENHVNLVGRVTDPEQDFTPHELPRGDDRSQRFQLLGWSGPRTSTTGPTRPQRRNAPARPQCPPMRQDAQVFAALSYAVHARIRYQPKSFGPLDRHTRHRPCVGAEPPPRPLRTRHRRLTAAPPGPSPPRAGRTVSDVRGGRVIGVVVATR